MYLSAPTKKGLLYYPEFVDALDDIKVMELIERWGCGGYFVWSAVMHRVFHDGYYIKVDIEKLAFAIVRMSGGKIKKDFALQVIYSCAEIGLLDKKLLSQGIITSVEIQRCWESAKAAARSKATIEEYNLLGNENAAGSGSSCPKTDVNAAITPINAAITPDNDVNNVTKQRKEKEIKEKNSCCASARIIKEFAFIKQATPDDMHQLDEFVKRYGEERVFDAVEKAAARGGRSTAYIERILQDAAPKPQPRRFEPTHSPEDIEAAMMADWFADAEDYLDDEQ